MRTGALSGFAWSESAGWIRMDPPFGGVTLDLVTYDFSGCARSEDLGFLGFRGTAPVVYGVAVACQAATAGGCTGTKPSSATVTVLQPPLLTKTYASSPIPLGAKTTLTYRITNPNATGAALSGLSFTDSLPAGPTVTKLTTSACGGMLVASPPGSISFTNGSRLSQKGTCSMSVTVTGTTAGSFTSTTSPITSAQNCQGSGATATLTVLP